MKAAAVGLLLALIYLLSPAITDKESVALERFVTIQFQRKMDEERQWRKQIEGRAVPPECLAGPTWPGYMHGAPGEVDCCPKKLGLV